MKLPVIGSAVMSAVVVATEVKHVVAQHPYPPSAAPASVTVLSGAHVLVAEGRRPARERDHVASNITVQERVSTVADVLPS